MRGWCHRDCNFFRQYNVSHLPIVNRNRRCVVRPSSGVRISGVETVTSRPSTRPFPVLTPLEDLGCTFVEFALSLSRSTNSTSPVVRRTRMTVLRRVPYHFSSGSGADVGVARYVRKRCMPIGGTKIFSRKSLSVSMLLGERVLRKTR